MRIPLVGGVPESVMDIEGHPINEYPGTTSGGFPSFRCPHTGAECVLAEKHEKQIVFSASDPVKGRKSELVKVPFNGVRTSWDLSPDGTRLAVTEFSHQKGEITLVSLNGGAAQKISAMSWVRAHRCCVGRRRQEPVPRQLLLPGNRYCAPRLRRTLQAAHQAGLAHSDAGGLTRRQVPRLRSG
jgi:hypothetical protein